MGPKFSRLSCIVSLLAMAGSVHTAWAVAPYVIGGPAASLAGGSGGWSWDGANISTYRNALGNTAFFGAGGIVSRPISTVTLTSITAGTLSSLNLFIAPYWSNGDSAPYVSLVTSYFQNGGSLLLLDDDSSYDAVAAALGIATNGGSTSNVTNGGAPLYSGPFGTSTNEMQGGDYGIFSASDITSHGGFVCGTNGGGQPVAACFPPGAYSAGAGAMVITTDVDMFSTYFTAVSYSPLNANGIFTLNATAYLMNATATPSVPTLSDSAVLALAVLLIASGIFLVARRRPASAA